MALPGGVDTVWALVTCYLVTALAWVLYRARGENRVPAEEAAALIALTAAPAFVSARGLLSRGT